MVEVPSNDLAVRTYVYVFCSRTLMAPHSARSPATYRNLKTLPSKPTEAVLRLQVNQLEAREDTEEPPVNTRQTQDNWHAPLLLERYGMGNTPGPNAPRPMEGVEDLGAPQTSYGPPRGEVSFHVAQLRRYTNPLPNHGKSLSPRVAQVTLRTPPAPSHPETNPAHPTVSPSDKAPSEVASTPYLSSESSRYHSLPQVDEVKEVA